jgi:hypothetical protein
MLPSVSFNTQEGAHMEEPGLFIFVFQVLGLESVFNMFVEQIKIFSVSGTVNIRFRMTETNLGDGRSCHCQNTIALPMAIMTDGKI